MAKYDVKSEAMGVQVLQDRKIKFYISYVTYVYAKWNLTMKFYDSMLHLTFYLQNGNL